MIPSSPTSHLLKFPSSTFSNDVIYDPCEQGSEEDQRQGNSNRNQIQNQSQFMYQNPSLSPSHHNGHSHSNGHSNGHSHCHNYYSGPVAMTPKKQRSKSFLCGGLKLSTNTTVNSKFYYFCLYFSFGFHLISILIFI